MDREGGIQGLFAAVDSAIYSPVLFPSLKKQNNKKLDGKGMRQYIEWGESWRTRARKGQGAGIHSLFRCHHRRDTAPAIFTSCHSSCNSVKRDLVVLACYDWLQGPPVQMRLERTISLNADQALFSQGSGRDAGQARTTGVPYDFGGLSDFPPSWPVLSLWFVL